MKSYTFTIIVAVLVFSLGCTPQKQKITNIHNQDRHHPRPWFDSGTKKLPGDEALKRMERAYSDPSRLMKLAAGLEAKGNFASAERQLREAIALAPKLGNQKGTHVVGSFAEPLGRVLTRQGKAKEAIPILEDSQKVSEDVNQALAIAYFEAGDLDKARPYYDENAIRSGGGWGDDTEDLPGKSDRNSLGASLYLARANTFQASLQLHLAKLDWMRAKELCPDNALVLYFLGDLYEGLGKWDDARACLRASREHVKGAALRNLLEGKKWAFNK